MDELSLKEKTILVQSYINSISSRVNHGANIWPNIIPKGNPMTNPIIIRVSFLFFIFIFLCKYTYYQIIRKGHFYEDTK